MLQKSVVVLGALTALVAFIEWLVGDDGEKAAKDRLADWYVYIGDGGLTNVISSSAALADGVLSAILGRSIISIRAILAWSVLLLVLMLVVYGLGWTLYNGSSPDYHGFVVYVLGWTFYNGSLDYRRGISVADLAFVATLAFGAVVCDFPALALNRFLFRKIAMSSRRRSVWVLLYLLFAYVAVLIPITVVARSMKEDVRAYLLEWPLYYIKLLFSEWWAIDLIASVFFLSTCLFLTILIAATMMQLLRPVLQPVALRVIERTASSKKGVFTAVSASLTAITGLLTVFIGKA